jgi:hypothetical protein
VTYDQQVTEAESGEYIGQITKSSAREEMVKLERIPVKGEKGKLATLLVSATLVVGSSVRSRLGSLMP